MHWCFTASPRLLGLVLSFSAFVAAARFQAFENRIDSLDQNIYADVETRLLPFTPTGKKFNKDIVVDTTEGKIKGSQQYNYRSFLGIPYGRSTGGERRWRAPVPTPQRPETSLYDATKFGDSCPQVTSVQNPVSSQINYLRARTASENCLNLDVYTLDAARLQLAQAKNQRVPVIVFLFGGGFDIGGSSEQNQYPEDLISKNDVVIVEPNFRIGPLGFLASNELKVEASTGLDTMERSFGNYGIFDIILALKWVKQNIANFGGDPDNITLMGFSAGSMAAAYLQIALYSSELAEYENLFHKIVMFSGAIKTHQIRTLSDYNTAQLTFDLIAEHVGCVGPNLAVDSASVMTCMRSKTSAEIYDLPIKKKWGDVWGPATDGVLFPRNPNVLLDEGHFVKVPVLATSNANDGSGDAILYNTKTIASLNAMVNHYFNSTASEMILSAYPVAHYDSIAATGGALITDGIFYCPTISYLSKVSKHVPVNYLTISAKFPVLQAYSMLMMPLPLGTFHYTPPLLFFNPIKWLTLGMSSDVTNLRKQVLAFVRNGDISADDNASVPESYRITPFSSENMDGVCGLWENINMEITLPK